MGPLLAANVLQGLQATFGRLNQSNLIRQLTVDVI